MEFVEAMNIVNRMCKNQEGCTGCPIKELRKLPKSHGVCLYSIFEYPEKAEAILAKWNADHPVKTLKDVFDEAFPDACRLLSGVPDICVRSLGYERCVEQNNCSNKNCIKCWNQEYKEPEK